VLRNPESYRDSPPALFFETAKISLLFGPSAGHPIKDFGRPSVTLFENYDNIVSLHDFPGISISCLVFQASRNFPFGVLSEGLAFRDPFFPYEKEVFQENSSLVSKPRSVPLYPGFLSRLDFHKGYSFGRCLSLDLRLPLTHF